MNSLKKLCKRYDVQTPADLIDNNPEHEHLYNLNIKSEPHQGISKVNHLRESIQRITKMKHRLIWLKEAKAHCDQIHDLINPDNLLDLTIKNETGFQEPIGFIEIRKVIDQELDDCEEEQSKLSKSNADVLSQASHWLDPLMDKIASIDFPTEKEVVQVFEEEYPGFEKEFDLESLPSPLAKGGEVVKKSIGEGARFIFKKRHDIDITAGAIIKRYRKRGL